MDGVSLIKWDKDESASKYVHQTIQAFRFKYGSTRINDWDVPIMFGVKGRDVSAAVISNPIEVRFRSTKSKKRKIMRFSIRDL